MGQVIEFPAGEPGPGFPAAQFAHGDPDKHAMQPGKACLARRARPV